MTEFKIEGIKLIKIFSLLDLLFKNGEQAKVFKIYGNGDKVCIDATTSVFFTATLCDCSEAFEQIVSYSDVVPFIDNDEATVTILPNGISISSSGSSIIMKEAFGEIFHVNTGDLSWRTINDFQALTGAFDKLEKLTDFRNAYRESKGVIVHKNIVYSIFPSAWFFIKVSSNNFSQMFNADSAKLIRNMLSAKSHMAQSAEYLAFRDEDVSVVMPRNEVEYLDPMQYEENAIYLGELDVKKLHESLKAAARLNKTTTVHLTTLPALNKLNIKIDVSSADISKRFDYESAYDIEMSMSLILGFLQCAFTPFRGKVGVYYCNNKTPLLMLKSEQVKCLMSLLA